MQGAGVQAQLSVQVQLCRHRCCVGTGVQIQVLCRHRCRCAATGAGVQAQVWYLDAAVAPVSHDDVAIAVHGHPCGCVELPVALPMRAKLEQELALCVVHLVGMGDNTWGS